ncbi:hypothetical protein TOK_1369 [Pseudonocardia sp. N23]|nr:hypothetical protein TOK_1369 [Pseudonocardia sp. N23]
MAQSVALLDAATCHVFAAGAIDPDGTARTRRTIGAREPPTVSY